ncbi:MAG: hypothetical protein M3N18_05820 [Actinomycetota bacterium]|nr:hypothetical protein [Actinomycetota bacterium]
MVSRNAFNEAAERLARTSVGSYKTLMDNTVALQERNFWFALGILDGSLGELRRQAGSNRAMSRGLTERTEGRQSAFQTLVGGPVNIYMGLLFAPFHYYLEGPRCISPEVMDSGGNGSLPIENYDKLTVGEVSQKLGDLSGREVRAVRSYERRHKNRGELLERLDRALV